MKPQIKALLKLVDQMTIPQYLKNCHEKKLQWGVITMEKIRLPEEIRKKAIKIIAEALMEAKIEEMKKQAVGE